MSIYAYVGLPGSGKSYGVVANQIIPALKQGRTVVTNIPLHIDKMREDFAVEDHQIREFPLEKIELEPELIEEYCKPGDVVVIDELWRLFPAGQKVDKVPKQFKSLLAEHRHRVDAQGRSMQIVFVTQDLQQIGNFARGLVEQTFVHTKLGFLGMAGSYKCDIFSKSVTGPNPPESRKIRSVLGKYSPNVYGYYKSHTMSESAGDGADEKVVDGRANIWMRKSIWIAIAFIVIGGPWAFITVTDFFTPARKGARAGAPAASPAGVGATAVRPLAGAAVTATPIRKGYRVAMVIQSSNAQQAFALLTDDAGEKIWIPASACMFDRMQWRCRYENKWWVHTGIYREPEPDKRPVFDAVPSLSARASS